MNVFKLDIFAGLSFAAPCLDSTHSMGLVMFFAFRGVAFGLPFASRFFVVDFVLVSCYGYHQKYGLRAPPVGRLPYANK